MQNFSEIHSDTYGINVFIFNFKFALHQTSSYTVIGRIK